MLNKNQIQFPNLYTFRKVAELPANQKAGLSAVHLNVKQVKLRLCVFLPGLLLSLSAGRRGLTWVFVL